MLSLKLILLILGLVFLILAAAGISTPRLNFGWLGLSLWLLGVIIS